MHGLLVWIPGNFQKLLAAGMAAGFLFSGFLAPVAALSDYLVAGIIFTGFLTRQQATTPFTNDLSKVLINIGLMKILFPVLIFLVARPLPADAALALVLLAALPAAGVSPSLIRLLGGHAELALKILLCESIASCLTVPLLFIILFSSTESVSSLALARYFSMVLLIPLILAGLVRNRIGPSRAAALMPWGSTASVLLIVTLVSAIAAKIGPSLMLNPLKSAGMVVIACAVVPVYALASVFANRPKTRADAITFGIKNMYINIGLGLGVASTYFNDGVALTLLAYVIPANLLPRVVANFSANRIPLPDPGK